MAFVSASASRCREGHRAPREQGCHSSIAVAMSKFVTARIAQMPDDASQPGADYPTRVYGMRGRSSARL
jgi:hypothetical protein